MKKPFISILLAITVTVASCVPAIGAETTDQGITDTAIEVAGVDEAEAEEDTVEETVSFEGVSENTDLEENISEETASEGTASEDAEITATKENEAEESVTDEALVEEDGTEEALAADTAAAAEEAPAADTAVEAEVAAEEEEVPIPDIIPGMESYQPETDISNDELFAAYVDDKFGISNELVDKQKGRKVKAGSKLTGTDKGLYNYISGQLPLIAAGDRTSSIFAVAVGDLGLEQLFWTAEELGVDATVENGAITTDAYNAVMDRTRFDLSLLIDALLADHPYLLYWYDKTEETGGTYFTVTAKKVSGEYQIGIKGSITLKFPVAEEYAAGDYEVNPDVGESVQSAVNNAAGIVSKYSGEQDFDILDGYRVEICDLTSYNHSAISGSTPYGNPWQLVWVFDGDDSTKVVCEGYSKAFKYLCDKTEFSAEIGCICVTGHMNGAGHMWNIVNMDDEQNYLVDVTNCDSRSNDSLFLAGSDGSPENGYTISSRTYVYDSYDNGDKSDMLELWGEENLTLKIHGYSKHEVSDWEITKESTCVEHGSRQGICDLCGDVVVEELELVDHTWEEDYTVDKTPTYTEEGVKSIHCAVCGDIKEDSEVAIDTLTVSEIADMTYTGEELTQQIEVKDGDVTLVEGVDYTVSYEDNINAGTAKVTLTNTGAYTGEYEKEFEIKAKEITPVVELSKKAFTYSGQVQQPSVVVKDGDKELAESDYDISWSGECINTGTYSATVVLKGNYVGTASASYTINKAANTITAGNLYDVYKSKKRTYGLGVKTAYGTPTYKSNSKSVTVSRSGIVTVKSKFLGRACITITSPGNANYISKTRKIYVIIRPTMTKISTLNNSGTKKMTVTWKQNKVGKGTQIQYSTSSGFTNAKIAWVTKNTITAKAIGNLTKGKKYYVRIRTYTRIGGSNFYSTWSPVKTVKIRK